MMSEGEAADHLELVFPAAGATPALSIGGERWSAGADSGPLCRVRVEGDDRWRAPLPSTDRTWSHAEAATGGWVDHSIELPIDATSLVAAMTIRAYRCAPVAECRLTVRNAGSSPVRITGVDTVALRLHLSAAATVSGYTNAWGAEFEPFVTDLAEDRIIEATAGRSSQGHVPLVSLTDAGRDARLLLAPMWSGNWIWRGDREAAGTVVVSCGLSDREFWYDLEPGASFRAPAVALAATSDPGGVSPLATAGLEHWYPRRPLDPPPLEWSSWFPYSDVDISEDVFTANLDVAGRLGLDLCMLDAGWFGPSGPTRWTDWRGDWDQVNTARFPQGLRALADRCRGGGLEFGIWCEIEGLGPRATLSGRRAAYEATRGGQSLGYVCFGDPDVVDWALEVVDRLVAETGCRWIKFDFNVDPGLGCDREDHGHGGGSGLYAHYLGYYAFLDRVREGHPRVVLENCSSGGLRIDLEMMRHLHVTYLSDLDWFEHSLQVFWGVTALLHPSACLKFSFSEWGSGHHNPRQTYSPSDPQVPSWCPSPICARRCCTTSRSRSGFPSSPTGWRGAWSVTSRSTRASAGASSPTAGSAR